MTIAKQGKDYEVLSWENNIVTILALVDLVLVCHVNGDEYLVNQGEEIDFRSGANYAGVTLLVRS